MNNKEDVCTTKVTKINNRWHCRLFLNGKLHDEMSSDDRRDIGFMCREMLRWVDKMGYNCPMADASRHRGKNHEQFGKIRYLGLTNDN